MKWVSRSLVWWLQRLHNISGTQVFKTKNAPDWYEETHERQRKAHSSRHIRVEHGIVHLKNWLVLPRHLGRRERMSHTIQAVASLLSHQQTADLTSARRA